MALQGITGSSSADLTNPPLIAPVGAQSARQRSSRADPPRRWPSSAAGPLEPVAEAFSAGPRGRL